MVLDLEDVIAGLDPKRKHRIEERAAKLIAREMTLSKLRRKAPRPDQGERSARTEHQLGCHWRNGVTCRCPRCAVLWRRWAAACR